MTAYRKVPCGHKPCHGDGTEKYGLVSCTAVHESHCQGLHDLDPCPGFTYEPWPEVETVVEAGFTAKEWREQSEKNLAQLTHYRSIGTPEQIEAVVEGFKREMQRPSIHKNICMDGWQGRHSPVCTALTNMKGSE